MIPGANVLGIAFSAIAQQPAQFLRAIGRTQNNLGAWVTQYAAPVDVRVSFQSMDSTKYQQLGLDLAKNYYSIWVKLGAEGVNRGASPDRFIVYGKLYEITTTHDWFMQDGWTECVVIEVTVPND